MGDKLHGWQQEMIDHNSDDPHYQHQLRCEFEADNEYVRKQQEITNKIQEVTKQIDDISAKIIKNGGSRFFVLRLIELVEKRCTLYNKKNALSNSSDYYR